MSVLSVHDKERTALHRIYYSVVSTIDAQQLIQGSTSGCVLPSRLIPSYELAQSSLLCVFHAGILEGYTLVFVSAHSPYYTWKPLGSLRQQQQLLRL